MKKALMSALALVCMNACGEDSVFKFVKAGKIGPNGPLALQNREPLLDLDKR